MNESTEARARPLYYRGGAFNHKRRAWKPHKALLYRVRKAVYERDDYTCQLCGVRATNIPDSYDGSRALYTSGRRGSLHLDHIIPYRDGGPFTVDNLRAACEICNVTRGARRDA